MTNRNEYDVIVIGGSYAGLSAAMALGRSQRQVLVIDSGLPCNRQTPHSHNFLTQDGVKPAVLAAQAREQVLHYPTVALLNDLAVEGRKTENGFWLTTRDGQDLAAKKLIFATGIKDLLLDIKGFSECWGISVIHCPYCHGYEFRGQKTAILANGERAFHLASLVHNLTKDITILTGGKAAFTAEQTGKLHHHQIGVIETELSEIEQENGNIRSVVFSNGHRAAFDAVYAALPFVQHSAIPAELGCERTEQGYLKIDEFQKTTVDGVFACGDNSSMMRSVANAVYRGNLAGAVVNKALTDDEF